jgi:hypothetical protein
VSRGGGGALSDIPHRVEGVGRDSERGMTLSILGWGREEVGVWNELHHNEQCDMGNWECVHQFLFTTKYAKNHKFQ